MNNRQSRALRVSRRVGESERVRNKRHDKRDRKLNETKAKSVVRHLGEELWGVLKKLNYVRTPDSVYFLLCE